MNDTRLESRLCICICGLGMIDVGVRIKYRCLVGAGWRSGVQLGT